MLARLALGFVATLAAGPAFAQFAPPGEPPAAEPTAGDVLTGVRDVRPAWLRGESRTDVIVGLPLAVRHQRRVGETRYWWEAGAGLLLIIPDAFVGVRADCGLYEGRRDSFWVRPGVDAHVLVWPYGSVFGEKSHTVSAAGGVAADVDLVWRRQADNVCGEFGVKLGVVTLVGRNGALPLPTVGLLWGIQF